jgi:hypothetical protein
MTYRAKAATVGNSKALRLDSALFREHPEFAAGEFTANVIAPGCLLIQSTSDPVPHRKTDAVFGAFLGFLEQQMARRPDHLSAVTRSDLDEANAVLASVQSHPDEDLGEAFVMPGSRPGQRPRKRPPRAAARR